MLAAMSEARGRDARAGRDFTRRRLACVLAAVLTTAAPRVTSAAVAVPAVPTVPTVHVRTQALPRAWIGPRLIWNPVPREIEALHGCPAVGRKRCVAKVMARAGASAQAIAFYRRTDWFCSKLAPGLGVVRVATLLDPWRANENTQPALVGGTPAVVYPEGIGVRLERDSGYVALKTAHPNVLFWGSGPDLERAARDRRGLHFIFRYRLLDGCHACPLLGWARVRFDFSGSGTFRGARLLGVTPAGPGER